MKKVLSIVLALLMLVAAIACTASAQQPQTTTEAPKTETVTEAPKTEPEPEPVKAEPVTALGLCIKNKSGFAVDALYIYPTGGETGNSVVEKGWPTKDVDKNAFEKNIYIVRPEGAPLSVLAVLEDGNTIAQDVGVLENYTEIKLEGLTVECEKEDDPEDQALIDEAIAIGKTADNVYPNYVVIPVEFKNKSKKGIKELYFYEEGGDPKTYNNMMDYLYTPEGVKVDVLQSGKAKEGGMYTFKCFIRPLADKYMIDVVFEDDTTLTYPIENWFKANADGFAPNEISLQSAEDPDTIKVQYDHGVPEPIDYLAEALEKGLIVDQWYPAYTTVNADPKKVEAARIELAKIPVPFEQTAEEPAEEPAAEPVAETPAGEYTALGLKFKNKSGVALNEVYIYADGDEKGANVLTLNGPMPAEEDEIVLYLFRETAKLDKMVVEIVYAEGDPFVWKLTGPLGNNYKLTVKTQAELDDWKNELIEKEKDLTKIAEFVAECEANGTTSDGFRP